MDKSNCLLVTLLLLHRLEIMTPFVLENQLQFRSPQTFGKCYFDSLGYNETLSACTRVQSSHPDLLNKNNGLIEYPGYSNWYISCGQQDEFGAPCLMCPDGMYFSNKCGRCTKQQYPTQAECDSEESSTSNICGTFEVMYGCFDHRCYKENQLLPNFFTKIAFCQCVQKEFDSGVQLIPICRPTAPYTRWEQSNYHGGYATYYSEYFDELHAIQFVF